MTIKQLIDKALSIPVEERALVVDSQLRSLNQPESETDKKLSAEANRRLAELRSGKVQKIPGDEVFTMVWKRVEA
jgi:hypothetical protein